MTCAAMSLSPVFVVTNALRLYHPKPISGEPIEASPVEITVKEEKQMETVIKVEGMMCNHCKMHVEKACAAVPGCTGAVVDLGAKNVTVTGDAKLEDLKKAIVEAGYEVVD